MVCVIMYFDTFMTKVTYRTLSLGTANKLEARRIQIQDKVARNQVHPYSSCNGGYTGSAGEMWGTHLATAHCPSGQVGSGPPIRTKKDQPVMCAKWERTF